MRNEISGRVPLVPDVVEVTLANVTRKVFAHTFRTTPFPSTDDRFRFIHALDPVKLEMRRDILA